MIKGLLRILATVSLALAVIMIVMDAARSLAAGALTVTMLDTVWANQHAASLEAARSAIETRFPAMIVNMMTGGVLEAPAFVIFGALAFILYAVGHRPQRKQQFAIDR